MNPISREALAAARATPAGPCRGRSGRAGDRVENLDLFARARHGVPAASHPGSDGPNHALACAGSYFVDHYRDLVMTNADYLMCFVDL